MSKRHNAYQVYTPQEEWEERPRVIQNIRRNIFHRYIEKRHDQLSLNQSTPDVVFLHMKL